MDGKTGTLYCPHAFQNILQLRSGKCCNMSVPFKDQRLHFFILLMIRHLYQKMTCIQTSCCVRLMNVGGNSSYELRVVPHKQYLKKLTTLRYLGVKLTFNGSNEEMRFRMYKLDRQSESGIACYGFQTYEKVMKLECTRRL